jgi:hypothetical protein
MDLLRSAKRSLAQDTKERVNTAVVKRKLKLKEEDDWIQHTWQVSGAPPTFRPWCLTVYAQIDLLQRAARILVQLIRSYPSFSTSLKSNSVQI